MSIPVATWTDECKDTPTAADVRLSLWMMGSCASLLTHDNTMLASNIVRSGRTTDGRSTDSCDTLFTTGRVLSAVSASSQAVMPRDRNSAKP